MKNNSNQLPSTNLPSYKDGYCNEDIDEEDEDEMDEMAVTLRSTGEFFDPPDDLGESFYSDG